MRTIRLTGPQGFGLEVDLKGADEGAVTSDLTDLFLQLGEAAKSKERGSSSCSTKSSSPTRSISAR